MNDKARISIQDSCNGLKKAKEYLSSAAWSVENVNIKKRIESQLPGIDGLISECEQIASDLSQG